MFGNTFVFACLCTFAPLAIEALCQTNADCGDPTLCCVITPMIVRKRLLFPEESGLYDKNFYKHECLPFKGEDAHLCLVRQQYSATKTHYSGYNGGCPCKPGLVCTPSDEFPNFTPRFGKCTPAV